MEAPLALYRRYRPGTFAEVVGQDQVTVPLCRALDANRVNHAYLFSGPRGCGKTTSARILARSLNCELGPTSTPCGTCRNCRDLAPGGPGSVDVIEIDAASHGGVDDARDLRERAFFSPVASRYKVYVVDEAHMVSSAGFNALLKVVEEPPEHLKFIFATTEPEKVIGTIRSRTHHYPFRLIPPRTMAAHLASIAEREGVPIAPAVLPLVVRAGGGSARDALSVLDQLIGGAGPDGVTYDDAIALLGYTSDALLDRVVDALAAYDGREVFAAVEQVIEAGQDPRRFVEDLLRRMRDLVVLGVVPDAGRAELLDVPPETVDALARQSTAVGRAAALRAAELLDAGVTDIRGATAPRLHLELLLARLLLPAAADGEASFGARLERLERRLASPVPDTAPASAPAAADRAAARIAPSPAPADNGRREPTPAHPGAVDRSTPPERGRPGQVTLADVRRLWPELLESLRSTSRFTWMALQGSQIVGLERDLLTIAVGSEGVRTNFQRGGRDAAVREALRALFALDVRVDVVVGPTGPGRTAAPTERVQPPDATRPTDSTRPDDSARPDDTPSVRTPREPAAGPAARATGPDPVVVTPAVDPPAVDPPAVDPPAVDTAAVDTPAGGMPAGVVWPEPAAPGGSRPPADPADSRRLAAGLDGTSGSGTSGNGSGGARESAAGRGTVAERLRAQAAAAGSPDDAVDPADADLDGPGLSTTELLTREFAAEVIEERPRVE